MRRSTFLAVALVLAVGACSSNTDSETPTETSAHVEVALDCEELGFPCTWDGVPRDLRERSFGLLRTAGEALDSGADPESIVDDLLAEDDVVVAIADETGIQIRLDGAPPVFVFDARTHPTVSAILDGATSQSRNTSVQVARPATQDLQVQAVAPYESFSDPRSGAGVKLVTATGDAGATYEPTRDPDIRPRSALVIDPWGDVDTQAVFNQMRAYGRLPPGVNSAEDLDLRTLGLGKTEAVLAGSEHIGVVNGADDGAFAQFAAHDLVFVRTHGSSFIGEECKPAEGHVCGSVIGGFPIDLDEGGDLASLEAAEYQPLPGVPGATFGRVNGWWTVAFAPDFFTDTYGGGRLDSIVIINACNSAKAGSVVGGIASTASSDAGPAVFGWDDYIDQFKADVSTAVLVDLLVNHGVTTKQAFDAVAAVPALVAHSTNTASDSPTLIRQGRELRARDVITVIHNGSAMEPGAALQVLGEPEDGAPDRIEELTLRVEGLTTGDLDQAVLTWQLLDKHSSPIEIENPFQASENVRVEELPDPDPIDGAPAVNTAGWSSVQLTLSNLDLEFDVDRDDLVRFVEHQLVVVLESRSGGGSSRHEIDPVFLRQGSIQVLDPELAQPLVADQEIQIEGQPSDGVAETYPLHVLLDHLDESAVDGLVLEVRLGEESLSIQSAEWERVEEGRYRVLRDVELADFEETEKTIAIEAFIETPEGGRIEFLVDPITLRLARQGCDYLSGGDMSDAMGRPFGDPELFQPFGPDTTGSCFWSAPFSTVEIFLGEGAESVEQLRNAASDPSAIDGFGDVAVYDLVTGRALIPSGIEVDGQMQYNNFVNLHVVIDDNTVATIHVQGNVVIEAGPETGLLDRLRALVEALRESL